MNENKVIAKNEHVAKVDSWTQFGIKDNWNILFCFWYPLIYYTEMAFIEFIS